MKVWKVDIEDLSHLGGPMGTEYTTSLGSEVFASPEKLLVFLNDELKGSRLEGHFKLDMIKYIKKEKYFDCNWIGFKIEVKEIL